MSDSDDNNPRSSSATPKKKRKDAGQTRPGHWSNKDYFKILLMRVFHMDQNELGNSPSMVGSELFWTTFAADRPHIFPRRNGRSIWEQAKILNRNPYWQNKWNDLCFYRMQRPKASRYSYPYGWNEGVEIS